MKRFALLLFTSILLFPGVSFAGLFQYTDGETSISANTAATTATVLLNARTAAGAPQATRLMGIEVWDNEALTGASIYKKTNVTGTPRIPDDSRQEHLIPNLLPEKTYYFKYYYGTPSAVIASGYVATLSGKTFQFKTEKLSVATQPYSIIATGSSGALITVNVTVPVPNDDTLNILVRKDALSGTLGAAPNLTGTGFVKLVPIGRITTGGTASFPIGDLARNTTYHLDLLRMNGTAPSTIIAKTSSATTDSERIYYDALEFIKKTSEYYVVKGRIDTVKHPATFKEYRIRLETTRTEGGFTRDLNFSPPDVNAFVARKGEEALPLAAEGIADNGGYYFHLAGLDKHATYHVRQVITSPSGATDVWIGSFNTDRGFIVPNSAQESADFERRSYRLLAPLPGLSVLLDPDLCLERVAQGKALAGTQICDINSFISFIFRLMIGLCAVMLVLRLIYEGYQYATTDIPFLQVHAKQKIGEAFLALLLALSAWLILNTINPRLVQNDISIANIDLAIENYATIDPQTYQQFTGQSIKAPAEYVKIVDTIAAQEGIDACIVKATIAIESTWRPDIIGCDENNGDASDVPSRKAFLGSKIRYDGTTFEGSSAKNMCPKKIDRAVAGYGLDWRFSKGGGLMQITKFPQGYNTPEWYEGVKNGGSYWLKRAVPFAGFEAIITPEANIKEGISLLKQGLQKCNNSVESTFRLYQAGLGRQCGHQSKTVNDSVAKKMTQYQLCKANPTTYGLSTPVSTTTTGTKSLLAVGDSLTAGMGGAGQTYIKLFAASHTDWSADYQSAAKGGMTTIWMEGKLKLLTGPYGVVTIMGGTNDVSSGFPVDQITARLDRMIKKAKTISQKVIVIAPPVMLKNLYPTYTTTEKINTSLETIRTFLSTYPGVIFIDMHTVTKNDPSLIANDGIHLTTKGQQTLSALLGGKI